MKYLLMNESIRKSEVIGHLKITKASGESEDFENCQLSIYDTSIVFNPSNADPIRVRYNQVLSPSSEDYALSIRTSAGDNLRFSQVGKEFESTVTEVSRAMNDLDIQSQALVKDLAPLANPSTVREAARLLKDGLAAKRSDLDAITPEIWQGFEKKFSTTNA
jgi:hypothetical protein